MREFGEARMSQIDHLGIAVKSLAEAKKFYEKLGLQVMPEETVEAEKVRLAMVPVGESRIELLEPTSPDSPIGEVPGQARRGSASRRVARQRSRRHGGAAESGGNASDLGRYQDWRGWTSLRFRASFQLWWRPAGTGGRRSPGRLTMLIVSVDTSGRKGSIALCRGDGDSFEVLQLTSLEGGTYSAQLLPRIAEAAPATRSQ